MVAELEDAFPDVEASLIEAAGGLFEVEVDGENVFSKKQLGRHAQPGEVVRLIRDRVSGA